MITLAVRALETQQFGQTCSVRVVFDHAKFDAKIKKKFW